MMSVVTPASEVILRHSDEFTGRHVLFAGNLQDNLAAQLKTAHSRVHTQQFHHWQELNRTMGNCANFSLIATDEHVSSCNTLIYFWPKNKSEARFQLQNLLSLLPAGSDIFIAGENRSGIRSAEQTLHPWAMVHKIDSARRCGLYYGRLDHPPAFNMDHFWSEYTVGDKTIKTLPGVFSRDGLDTASELLLSTLSPGSQGRILDIGCGAGVLSALFATHSPQARLWMTDVSAAAIASSQATLAANHLSAEIFASNVFSAVTGRFDMILSNPPFHEGLHIRYDVVKKLIRESVHHLNSGGELRIVANAFLPYPALLKETFGSYDVMAHTGRFIVYRAFAR